MYLHLGNEVAVALSDIIGIFDMDNTTVSYQTRDFLAAAQKNGTVIDVTEDLPKSFIIVKKGGKILVYISSLASRTLLKRAKSENIIM
ncbi:MAG: DUF370 domain-containing protein [Clostridiales bacterium]|nr:DUF370 domain-containing protein [Clostridiales bacterium]